MIVFRLSKAEYRNDLSGRGAEMVGGRWNSVGLPMLYTACNRALCVLEMVVHTPLHLFPSNFWLISIDVPDGLVMGSLEVSDLPLDWRMHPHSNSTKAIGDAFLREQQQVGLRLPSAVVPSEQSILLNPRHPDFQQIRILHTEPFSFDDRLFKR
jgi:RES domain-containing protein